MSDLSLSIPTIDTERLLLRGHRTSDLQDCAAMWSHPEVTRHITGRPLSEEEVWARLLRYIGHWAVLGFGLWAVQEKASGRFVGDMGIADFKRDMKPSLEGAPEAAWVLAPWAHGKGFATEAVHGALGWFEGRFGKLRTVCLIAPDNAASIRVAEKCGYEEWTRAVYKEEPTIVFERV